jgi:hypothetical protein
MERFELRMREQGLQLVEAELYNNPLLETKHSRIFNIGIQD